MGAHGDAAEAGIPAADDHAAVAAPQLLSGDDPRPAVPSGARVPGRGGLRSAASGHARASPPALLTLSSKSPTPQPRQLRGEEHRTGGARRSGGDPRGRGPGGEREGTRAAPPRPRPAPTAWALSAARPGGRGRAGAPSRARPRRVGGDDSEDVNLPPPSSRAESPQRPSSLHLIRSIVEAAATARNGERSPAATRARGRFPPSVPALWSRPAPDGDPGLPRARPPGQHGREFVPQVWPALSAPRRRNPLGLLRFGGKAALALLGLQQRKCCAFPASSVFLLFFLKTPNSTQRAEHVQSAKS